VTLFRHSEAYLALRIDKEPLHRKTAKRLELQFGALLIGTGISNGEAMRVAEEVSRNPQELAERLHQIATDYLSELAVWRRAFGMDVEQLKGVEEVARLQDETVYELPAVKEVIQLIDGGLPSDDRVSKELERQKRLLDAGVGSTDADLRWGPPGAE
jgi:hypothetical protein